TTKKSKKQRDGFWSVLPSCCLIFLLCFSSLIPLVNADPTGIINTPTAYDWPMFQHDAGHSGSIVSPAPFSNHKLATGSARGGVRASMATKSPYLYAVGSSLVYSLNASTLASVWQTTIGVNLASSPAVSGGIVYVGSSDGKLYALSASTGQILWSFTTTAGMAVVSSPVVRNGVVFVGSDDAKVYAISASSHKLVWSFPT